jgi:ABC-type transporter Mla subunit MlaD
MPKAVFHVHVHIHGLESVSDQLGAMLEGIADLKGMIMSQSGQIGALVEAQTAMVDDVEAILNELRDLVANPSDASNLSPEAQAKVDAALAALAAARERLGVGDENEDGVPAAPFTSGTSVSEPDV